MRFGGRINCFSRFIRGCEGDKGEFPNHCYITRAFFAVGVDDKGKYKVLEGRGCLYQLLLMDDNVFEMGGQCKCVSTFFLVSFSIRCFM